MQPDSNNIITLPSQPPKIVEVPTDFHNRLIDKIIVQSGGVSLGIILSFWGIIYFLNRSGVTSFIKNTIESLEEANQISKALVDVLKDISIELKDNHKEEMAMFHQLKDVIHNEIKPILRGIEKDISRQDRGK
jgi:hypothetical protein